MKSNNRVSGFEALICDFDDTLMATRKVRTRVLRDVLREFGYECTEVLLDQHWGKPFPTLVEGIAPGIDHEIFGHRYSEALRLTVPEVHAGAHDLLEMFAAAGVPVLIVTSSLRILVEIDLAQAGLLDAVDELWCSDDTAAWKPDPRVLDEAMANLDRRGVKRSRTLYVGDGLGDHTVAAAWGLTRTFQ